MKSNKLGFSLIELLVALSILAVVAAIIVPRFLNVRDNAAQTTFEAQAKSIQSIHNNWVSLGGAANGANGLQVLQFISTNTSATSTSTRGLTGNPCRDTTDNFGSRTISIQGLGAIGTAIPTSASADGLHGVGNNIYYKSGNKYWTINYTAADGFLPAAGTTANPGLGAPVTL